MCNYGFDMYIDVMRKRMNGKTTGTFFSFITEHDWALQGGAGFPTENEIVESSLMCSGGVGVSTID